MDVMKLLASPTGNHYPNHRKNEPPQTTPLVNVAPLAVKSAGQVVGVGVQPEEMKYPSTIVNGYFNTSGQYRQVNLHIGRKKWYWFVEPVEAPIITDAFEVPMTYQFGQAAGSFFSFYHFKIKRKGFEVNENINLTGLIELTQYLKK